MCCCRPWRANGAQSGHRPGGDAGCLERYGVEMIGAKLESIKKAEDRDLFKEAMRKAGLDLPRSGYARSMRDAMRIQKRLNFPVIIRASRTLGGSGGNFAFGPEEFKEVVQAGLSISPVHEVLIEESILGWKEFELEVMRDHKDNVVIICSIENFDPMGVHTGDSITVAPAQTLTDKEYQIMRDAVVARDPRNRRRNRRFEYSVCGQSERRPHGGHRDEPPRLAQLGAGEQSHRLSHRQDRREAGGGIHAG